MNSILPSFMRCYFATNPAAIQETKMSVAVRQKGDATEPVETLNLMRHLGVTRASRLLGVSTTTLYHARTTGLVSRVIEVAAGGAMRSIAMQRPPAKLGVQEKPAPSTVQTVVVLLEVEATQVPVVERFAKALNAPLLTS
jgi:hypothetical protein